MMMMLNFLRQSWQWLFSLLSFCACVHLSAGYLKKLSTVMKFFEAVDVTGNGSGQILMVTSHDMHTEIL